MIEQVSSFLWFVTKVKRIEPVLAICGDVHTVQDFKRFTSEKPKTKGITCSRYISTFFSIIKFLTQVLNFPRSLIGRWSNCAPCKDNWKVNIDSNAYSNMPPSHWSTER